MPVGRRILGSWGRGGGTGSRALAGHAPGAGQRANEPARRRTAGGRQPTRTQPSESPAGAQAADGKADGKPADHETAELTAHYWRVYDQRMATVRFKDVARRFPALIGQAVSLGWSASRRDTAATIGAQPGLRGVRRVRAVRHHGRAAGAVRRRPHPAPGAGGAAVADPGRGRDGDPLRRRHGGRVGAEPAGAAGGPGRRGAAVRPDQPGGAGRLRRLGLPRPAAAGPRPGHVLGVGAGQRRDQLRHRVRGAGVGGGGRRGAAARSCSPSCCSRSCPARGRRCARRGSAT